MFPSDRQAVVPWTGVLSIWVLLSTAALPAAADEGPANGIDARWASFMNRPIPDWELELKTLLGERTYTRQLILFRTHQDHFSSFHAFLSVRFSKSYQRHSVWRRVGIGFALAGISALIPGIAFAVHDYRSTETDGSDEFFSFSGAFVAGSVLTMVGSLFIIWGTVQLIVSSVKEKRAKKVLHILGYTPRSGSRDNPR